ncbi:restriction endonuclease subunit S [Vibrio campbellii]|uniref:restriction endonuclease subunit S n=1 Tax=Vibrio campbellii TaxID=680 RepID=UPI004056DE24
MSELPKGWFESSLIDLAKFIDYRGRTPKKTEEGIPLITAKNIKDGFINREPREFIAEVDYDGWMTRGIPKVGDVLLTTEAPLGNVAQIDIEEKFALAQRAICFQFYESEVERFIYYYLRSPLFNQELGLNSTGSTVKGIKAATLKKLPVHIAPLAEQKRIVEKLDEVLAQVDTIKARLDGIPALLKRFRQSVLASAVSGKLTEEWRGSNAVTPVTNLIQSCVVSDKRNNQNADKPFRQDEITKEVPASWTWVRLARITEVVSGVAKGSKTKSEVVTRPYLRVANVQRGFLDLSEIKEIAVPVEKANSLVLLPGDILFNEGGDIDKLGRGWIWEGQVSNCIHQNHVFRARVYSSDIEPKYVSHYGNSSGKEYFLREGTQSVNLANINKTTLSLLPVPLPPKEEQKEIVRLVDQYFAFADTIEAQVKKAQARVDNLTQSILAKAFRGELVAQDPNDEPADKLLERIEQARKEAEALAKAAKKAQSTKSTAKKKVAKSA